ncbi:alkaline phosphatase family protein, partial [Planctomycetota bacterium]
MKAVMDTHANIDVRSIAPTVCKLLGVAAPDECEVESVPEVIQALSERPRIAVIVLDAVGIATINLHREQAPFLMEQVDLNFLPMRAVFPTITPVNFASMATGVSPVTHSIRDREETIIHDTVFDALRRGGRSSAVSARQSSSLNLLLSNKADTRIVSQNNQDREVIDQVENLLETEIPDFVWVQLLDMDDAQHKFGVINPSAARALGKLDRNLKHLCAIFHDLEYGIIICADHGQHDKDDNSGGTHDGTAPE